MPLNTSAVLEYGDQEEFMVALRRIAVAFGMKAIAEMRSLTPNLFTALCFLSEI